MRCDPEVESQGAFGCCAEWGRAAGGRGDRARRVCVHMDPWRGFPWLCGLLRELQNGGPGTAPEARQPDLCSTALAMEIGHLGHTRKDGGSSSGCSIRQRALVLFPMSASWLS